MYHHSLQIKKSNSKSINNVDLRKSSKMEWAFLGSSVDKESAYSAGDLSSIPGLGRAPGEVNGNALQFFCLENPMDRGAWRATVRGVARVGHELANKPLPQLDGVRIALYITLCRMSEIHLLTFPL